MRRKLRDPFFIDFVMVCMKKIFVLLFAILLNVHFAGCSIFVSKTQLISINGTPGGAEVIVNGLSYTAPCTARVSRDVDIDILIMKDGYQSKTIISNKELSATGILDIVGTWAFLFPALGLIAPGAWVHKQTNFYYVLERKVDYLSPNNAASNAK